MSLNVLHLIKSRHFAGSEQYLLTLGELLRAAGHTVHVGCVRGGRMEAATRDRGLPLAPVDLALPLAQTRLAAWARRHEVALVHTHLTGAARIGHGLARRLGVPCVAHLHVYRLHPVFRHVAEEGGCLVAVSSHIAATFRAGLALTPAQVRVVLNSSAVASHPDALRPVSDVRGELAAELGLDGARPWVLMPGRLSQGKGQDVLLAAVARLRDAAPSFRVLIAGSARSGSTVEAALRRQVRQAGLEDCVRFLGFRGDMPRLLRAADVVVVPSRFDVLPLVVLEAMMLGKCLIASAVGGVPEVVTDGEHGRLVPPGDAVALADALGALVGDAPRRQLLGERARAHAMAHLSPAAMRAQIEAIYRELLAPAAA